METSNRPTPSPRPIGIVVAIAFLTFAGAMFYWASQKVAHQSKMSLYLPRADQSGLVAEPVTPPVGKATPKVPLKPEAQVRNLISALVEKSGTAPEGQWVVPKGTKLLKASLAGDTVTLDFNSALEDSSFWSGSEHEYVGIYAIVNTATQVPGVKYVKFQVEGKEIDTLGGHVELTEPLERDDSLLGKSEGGKGP